MQTLKCQLACWCVLLGLFAVGCKQAEQAGGSSSTSDGFSEFALPTKTQPFDRVATKPIEGDEFTNSMGMKFVRIKPGSFVMGWDEELKNSEFKYDYELLGGPQQTVKISKPFFMATHEVTQGQYEQLMGSNPSAFHPDALKPGVQKVPAEEAKMASKIDRELLKSYPVERVTWFMAMDFCKKLSEQPEEVAAGRVYTLPTEAQWEYAARAGSTAYYGVGDGKQMVAGLANFNGRAPFPKSAEPGDSVGQPLPVGQFKPNAWGLYDMHGNIAEWCLDPVRKLTTGEVTDPMADGESKIRSVRGGDFNDVGYYLNCLVRNSRPADGIASASGFRVIVQLKE